MSTSLEASTLFRVDGIVAAITGGGTGIGLVMAKALMANGAKKVYILGRRQEILDAAARETKGLVPIQCDVTSKASLQAAVDKITADTGYINLLVANSGLIGTRNTWGQGKSIQDIRRAMFTDHSMEHFTEAFHVNVTGAFFTIGAFLELLDAGNHNSLSADGFGGPVAPGIAVPAIQSQVVVTSSISAFIRGAVTPPSYGGSKAAIMHLAKQASSQLAPHGIRVNVLAPGLFPSELAAGLIGNRAPAEETPDDPRFIPAKRFGGDEEMAGMILYLASRAGSYCDGLVLVADGGRLSVMTASY
ncbi:NAD(P)-binding protein [Coniochaeta ligniaria NRRL 30616]|uniref:NAD(P)-binding protein n=1 Tax=Coniochaeta ligniaria NRRL 30616 TaxID=1408157 RepID=A0A1J7IFP6_9PEZI|nr:NAD(P)-binding protein [Coniochaeta ligniaria NRRL 30616]